MGDSSIESNNLDREFIIENIESEGGNGIGEPFLVRLRNCSIENVVCNCGDVISPHSLPNHLKSLRHRLNIDHIESELSQMKKINKVIDCLIENSLSFNLNYDAESEESNIVINFGN